MKKAETFAFWDLIVEEAYEPQDETLRKGSWKQFKKDARNKDIYIFGCNDACKDFIQAYKEEYHIAGILDNSKVRWGTRFNGVDVLAPTEIIPQLNEDKDMILIAMRLNADAVAMQLQQMGWHHYYGLGVLVSGMYPYSNWVKIARILKKYSKTKDVIIMESTNDFDGNSGALYEYLKKQNSRHKFVWIVKEEENKKFLADKKDVALCPRKNIGDIKKYIFYRAVSRWQIWDNHPVRKVRADQTNIFLQHFGMGYKQIANVFNAPKYVDYVLTTNKEVYEMEKDSLCYGPDTEVVYGELPRNDVLFSREWHELEKIVSHTYDKVVMWAPTLRNSKLYNRIDSDLEYPYGISVVYEKSDMDCLNEFLSERNMLLLIKIHPRQKCDHTEGKYSNILYLNGETVKQVHAYKLLTQMDAMISDYSSMVFDYMLLDRPIAWALEDMDHYQIDFLMENPLDFMPGEKIYNLEDLFVFLQNVKDGKDPYKQERNVIAKRYNAPIEGKGCENIAKVFGL